MLKFDEQKQIDSVRGALALRTSIEKIIDEAWELRTFAGLASAAPGPRPCRRCAT